MKHFNILLCTLLLTSTHGIYSKLASEDPLKSWQDEFKELREQYHTSEPRLSIYKIILSCFDNEDPRVKAYCSMHHNQLEEAFNKNTSIPVSTKLDLPLYELCQLSSKCSSPHATQTFKEGFKRLESKYAQDPEISDFLDKYKNDIFEYSDNRYTLQRELEERIR